MSVIISDRALANILNTGFDASYSFLGGTTTVGTGSVQLDSDTGNTSGGVTFNTILDDGATGTKAWWFIPIGICLLICYQEPVYLTHSLLELSGGEISGTMTANMGAAGVATFTSHVTGGSATVTGDFTGVDFSLIPSLTQIDITTDVLITGTGSGQAESSGIVSIAGTGITLLTEVSYDFLGNPSLALPAPIQINSEASISQTSPTTYELSGHIEGHVISSPSTWILILAGSIGFVRRLFTRTFFCCNQTAGTC